jgi:hypothetical protein
MLILGLLKLSDEFVRLLFNFHEKSAVDIKIYIKLGQDWFVGLPVYQLHTFSTYPPASHLIFWPLTLAPESVTRWMWAGLNVGLLIWLAIFAARTGRGQSRWEKIFLALIPLSMNATGVVIGNGQITLLVIVMLWLAISLSINNGASIYRQMLVVPLFLVALVKPSLAAPFFWIVLFTPRSILMGVLIGAAYLAATMFSLQFQTISLSDSLIQWLGRATDNELGYANIQTWLYSIQLKQLILPTQFILLSLLGWWVYINRKGEFYILAGVVALFSRLWAYHAVYDDVIVIFAMLALVRLSQQKKIAPSQRMYLECLVVLNVLVMLMPARMQNYPQPFEFLFIWGHGVIWLLDLAILLWALKARPFPARNPM